MVSRAKIFPGLLAAMAPVACGSSQGGPKTASRFKRLRHGDRQERSARLDRPLHRHAPEPDGGTTCGARAGASLRSSDG